MGEKKLTNSLLYLMAIGAGLVVANNYYNQPLLNQIANTFGVSESKVSNIPLFTQLGYAFGLLFIIPLGDKISHKRIIMVDFLAIVLSLLLAATAKSLLMLTVASFFIGASSVIPQLFVPMAALLADKNSVGRAIGIVMSGLLIGILGSRFISGFVGEHYGWRSMYYLASGLMIIYWVLLKIHLPELHPDFKGTYVKLMKSILHYFKKERSVRLAALRGGLGFAGFSAFWTTLVFLMEDSFNYGSTVTGSFGILGIFGALAASKVGKMSDHLNKNLLITIASMVMILSWVIFLFSEKSIFGLIIGVLLIDMALQSLHITNQNIIFSRNPEARNRVNTIYMVGYFIGGALGTVTGALAWETYKWTGVATLGLVYSLLVLVFHLLFKKPVE
ncbi:MFS transporter [Kriegella aquimaris]|uniref:Predicted arabinose efflux permease, MFS family n=1 Tax=Kriegella aquimaris TaxID=192904 RepID=A0A1G9T058_9FLAO|nr:MFS transporter [Kriegella aquimaris]SDM41113.1 Predicted arabinose efflux permease, MFS family [Kriegella aquimaris]